MTAPALDKHSIARSFSMAAGDYDVWATAQAAIAAGLVGRLPSDLFPRLVADLGCGTGLLSARLLEKYPEAHLVGIDLAPGMVQQCRRHWAGVHRVRFVLGDAEHAQSVVPGVDLIACSCAAQWFADPEAAIRMWLDTLVPGGLAALTVLVEGSFPELGAAYRSLSDATPRGLVLPSSDAMPRLMRDAGLRVRTEAVEDIPAQYASARDALHSFRRIGARLGGQPLRAALEPSRARQLLAAYPRQTDGSAAVTYRVQYVIAEKPAP